ncbi:MAG: sodium/solute symporter [Acidimicrobiia bacterium]|nr:sodium/solute symporter [Acidimicrobiia bacterium]
MKLHTADYAVIIGYFVFVLGIGFVLKNRSTSGVEFFLSGRSLPAWITGLAFISANLGSLEVMGHAANAAKYGMMAASCFYWLGAIPAMLFLGVVMMPFYYQTKVRSSPEYLKLRFDERCRGFNAIGFAILTVFMSGINMYAMALVFNVFLNWSMDLSIWLSASTVMIYVLLGGLRSAIYNEVLQFFLVFAGLMPLTFMGLAEVGGWKRLVERLPWEYGHAYAVFADPLQNPMGVSWYAVVFALTIGAGTSYWCTDFLIVQRALAARDLTAARQTPLIAAFFKMLLPGIIIVPGLIALAVIPDRVEGQYNMVIPYLLERYYQSSPGLLGVGLTALLASFMSGMAGNVTAFNTVWTYDIYQPYFRPRQSENHYLWVGRMATVFGTVLSVATSYLVIRFKNMGDYLVLIFSLFIFPMSTAFLSGMFWKRTTSTGAFYGMATGVVANIAHYLLYRSSILPYRTEMAANIYIMIVGWTLGLAVTIVLSLVTTPRPESELVDLVHSLSTSREERPLHWFQAPVFWAAMLLGMLAVLAYLFW